MHAHYLQHVPYEGLGSIAPWLVEAGYEISRTAFFESPELPPMEAVDLLVVMGGTMSVNDEAEYPWLREEKRFIRAAIEAGKPVLGVCLGAQLIASAMGAAVVLNPVKEIGWFPVEGIEPGDESCFRFPPSTDVFHWHGETFELPAGAVHLARSAGCENQAFQLGRSVVGLQFHLETTRESAYSMVSTSRDELVPGPYVQTEEAILDATPAQYAAINRLMGDVLSYLRRSSGAGA